MRWFEDVVAPNALMWVSVLVLVLCLVAVWVRGKGPDVLRSARRRARPERAPDDEAGAESLFMAPSSGAHGVEVVDLDALLAGEPDPIAAAARLQLEQPTSLVLGNEALAGTIRPGPAAPPAQALAVPTAPPHMNGAATFPGALGAAPAPAAGAAAPVARRREIQVPVRELALAWFEARGYRAAPASEALRPIELVLRHRQNAARAYAFVVELTPVSAERALELARQARSIGLMRLLVAAEAGVEPDARDKVRKQGVRLIDQDTMQREFDQIEISVAAKIIAVARGRAHARAAAAAPRPGGDGPGGLA